MDNFRCNLCDIDYSVPGRYRLHVLSKHDFSPSQVFLVPKVHGTF